MEQDKAHTETDERLQSLEKEALNEALNRMSFDELLRRRTALLFPQTEGEPLLNEETRRAQIDRLLAQTREPSAAEGEPVPPRRRRTVRRLAVLAAAVVLLVAALAVAAVASRREFRILGGSVRFENGHAVVRFPKPDDAPELTLSELETALREHGFDGVYLPAFFYDGTWGAEHFNCRSDDDMDWASFDLVSGDKTVNLAIWSKWVFSEGDTHLPRAQGIRTIEDGAQHIYLIDQGEGTFQLICLMEQFQYTYLAELPEETMEEIAASILQRDAQAAAPERPDQAEADPIAKLKHDLAEHGFRDLRLPEALFDGTWQVKDVHFQKRPRLSAATVRLTNNGNVFGLSFRAGSHMERESTFPMAESATTVQSGGTPVYLFMHENGAGQLIYFSGGVEYSFSGKATFEDMKRIAESVP